jgi:hypothetical protein
MAISLDSNRAHARWHRAAPAGQRGERVAAASVPCRIHDTDGDTLPNRHRRRDRNRWATADVASAAPDTDAAAAPNHPCWRLIMTLSLAPDAVQRWVQALEPQHATQALLGFGLWSPRDGAAPTDNLDAAYALAQRVLGLARQAISFRPEGRLLVCHFVYAGQPITAAAQPHALALTRAVLRAAYETHRL